MAKGIRKAGLVLNYLGKQHSTPVKTLDRIPWQGGSIIVTLDCSEFTSHCPVTKQPDFGSLVIQYAPDKFIAETKSVKLYLWKFRNIAAFNEQIVAQIADEFFRQIQPRWVDVTGKFAMRGGISVSAVANRGAECPA